MIRRLTPEQKAVISKIRLIGKPVRPTDILGPYPLPTTESSARRRLKTLAEKRCLRKFGRPFRYEITQEKLV